MKYKFLMEEVAEDARQQFAEAFGEALYKDALVYFSYRMKNGDDRSCFTLLNGMRTEVYTANMMVAGGDERDCLCVYSPYRSRLDRSAKRGYAIFDTSKPIGRPVGRPGQERTENCPGCKLTIRDLNVIINIKVFNIDPTDRPEKGALIEFMSKLKKEVEEHYEINVEETNIIFETRDYRTEAYL